METMDTHQAVETNAGETLPPPRCAESVRDERVRIFHVRSLPKGGNAKKGHPLITFAWRWREDDGDYYIDWGYSIARPDEERGFNRRLGIEVAVGRCMKRPRTSCTSVLDARLAELTILEDALEQTLLKEDNEGWEPPRRFGLIPHRLRRDVQREAEDRRADLGLF